MRSFVLSLIALTLMSSSAFASALYKKSFTSSEEGDAEKRVIETFKAALSSSKNNPVKVAVDALKADLVDVGSVSDVSENDLFLIYSGKGSASSYGRRFLVGIPVTMQGTGMIEQYELYFTAYYAIDMAKSAESVTIEQQVVIPE